MGLDQRFTRYLLAARRDNIKFTRVLMIGRQGLHIEQRGLEKALADFGFDRPAEHAARLLSEGGGYAEPFFKLLGAEAVDSMDASTYENATFVHDMNRPIDDSMRGKYSVVIDGGTLEHVFNYPQALRNCMEMVEQGGHLIIATPANNFLGHGFYQLSPELFHRTLCEANGYALERLLLAEENPRAPWYSVIDSAQLRWRQELVNSDRTTLFATARRVAMTPIFEKYPQEGYYTKAWDGTGATGDKKSAGLRALAIRVVHSVPMLKRMVFRRLRGWKGRGFRRDDSING